MSSSSGIRAAAVERVLQNPALKDRIDASWKKKSKNVPNSIDVVVAVLQDLVLTVCGEPVCHKENEDGAAAAGIIHTAAARYSSRFVGPLAQGIAYHVAAIHLIQRHVASSTNSLAASLAAELDLVRKYIGGGELAIKAKPHDYILRTPTIVESIRASILRYKANADKHHDDPFDGLMFLALCRGCIGVPATDVVMYLMNLMSEKAYSKAPHQGVGRSPGVDFKEQEREHVEHYQPSNARKTVFMKAAEAELELLDLSIKKHESAYGHGDLRGSSRDLVSLSHPGITDLVQDQFKNLSANELKVGNLYDLVRNSIAYLLSTGPDDDDEEEEDSEAERSDAVGPDDLTPVFFLHILRWKGRLFTREDTEGRDAFVNYLSKLINDPVMSLGKAMHHATMLGRAAEYDADKGCIGRWDWGRVTISYRYKQLPAFAQATNIIRGVALLHAFRRASSKEGSTFFTDSTPRTSRCVQATNETQDAKGHDPVTDAASVLAATPPSSWPSLESDAPGEKGVPAALNNTATEIVHPKSPWPSL